MRVVSVQEVLFGSELASDYPRIANYITNPRFETNTTGWAAAGTGATITRDTAVTDDSTATLRLNVANPGATTDRAEYSITLNAGEEYIFRGRLRGVSGRSIRLWVVDSTSTSLGQMSATGDGATFADFEVRFTATANNAHLLRFGRVSTGADDPIYGCHFQLIRVLDGLDLLDNVDGSMLGYKWSGTADASTTLEYGWLEVADPTDFEEEGGKLQIGNEVVLYTSADEVGRLELAAASNGIKNPSFETNLNGWSSAGGGTTTRTRDTTESAFGVASQKCVTDGTASGQGANYNDSNLGVRVSPGETWTASGLFLQPAGGMSARITIEYKTVADVSLGVQSGNTFVLTAGRWTMVQATAIAPAGAYKAYIRYTNVNATAVTFFIDGCRFSKGNAIKSYEDGTDLASTYSAEEPVLVYPRTSERVALLTDSDAALDDEESMHARVPHALYDKIPVGLRGVDDGEAVEADFEGDEFVISDLLGQEPTVDGSYIEPNTIPSGAIQTDGLAPSTSPTPTVQGGVGFLAIKWTAISNPDEVTYDVHISGTNGFTPDGTTKIGETPGTLAFIRKMPDNSALVYETSPGVPKVYYVKIVARDRDGSGPASTQGTGSLDPAGSPDILAGAITAEKLETVLSLATSMVAGTLTAQRVEIGYGTDGLGNIDTSFIGVRAFTSGSVTTFSLDGATGDAFIKGRMDFGSGSRLLSEDIIELGQQTSTGFQTPSLVQSMINSPIGQGSIAFASWPAPTTTGNCLLMVIHLKDFDGTAPTPTTPAGWTLETTTTSGSGAQKLLIYRNTTGASQSGDIFVTLNDTCAYHIQIYEYSGVQVASPDQVATNTGTGTALTSGTTATTAQANDLLFAAFAVDNADAGNFTSPTNSFTFVRQVTNVTHDTRLSTLERKVTATGAYSTGVTAGTSSEWVGAIVALKAKSAGVETPVATKIRIYNTLDRFGLPAFFTKDDTGAERAMRPFQDVERRIQHVNDLLGANFGVSAGANSNIDGMFQAVSNGAASAVTSIDPEAGHPGLAQLDTGTSTTGSAYISTRGQSIPAATGDIIRITAVIKTNSNLSNGTNRFAYAIGFFTGSDPTAVTTPGVWVFYQDVNPTLGGGGSLTAGNWGLIHGDGTDLAGDPLDDGGGITLPAAATWYRIDLEHKVGTGTSVWINGVKKVSNFSTNLFAGGTLNQIQVGIRKSLGGTGRTMLVDLVSFEYIMTASR